MLLLLVSGSFIYTLEDWHGTYKSPIRKGRWCSKPLIFRGVLMGVFAIWQPKIHLDLQRPGLHFRSNPRKVSNLNPLVVPIWWESPNFPRRIWFACLCLVGDFSRILPWEITIKTSFGEYILFFSQPPWANLTLVLQNYPVIPWVWRCLDPHQWCSWCFFFPPCSTRWPLRSLLMELWPL